MPPARRFAALCLPLLLLPACQRHPEPPERLVQPAVTPLAGGGQRVRSPGPTRWHPGEGWQLLERGSYGVRGGGPGRLLDPTAIAVAADGQVLVADGVVKAFAPDGRFLGIVGGPGEGPGQYRSAAIATYGNLLLLQDNDLGRMSVYDADGRFQRSWVTPCCTVGPPATDVRGRIYLELPPPRDGRLSRSRMLLRYRLDGTVLDTLALQLDPVPGTWRVRTGTGLWQPAIPFWPARALAIAPDGDLVHGWSGDYLVARGPSGKDTTLLFGRDWTAAMIPEPRREAALRALLAEAKRRDAALGGIDPRSLAAEVNLHNIPNEAPAFTALAVDGRQNVWVTMDPGMDSSHSHFEVYDAEGYYLGPVTAPVVFPPGGGSAWTRDDAYAITRDPDGTAVVLRYAVMRTPIP